MKLPVVNSDKYWQSGEVKVGASFAGGAVVKVIDADPSPVLEPEESAFEVASESSTL
jgi:hypothetical protein